MLEHIIYTPVEGKLYKFTPEKGFRLFDKVAQVYRPEAITDLKTARKQLVAVAEIDYLNSLTPEDESNQESEQV